MKLVYYIVVIVEENVLKILDSAVCTSYINYVKQPLESFLFILHFIRKNRLIMAQKTNMSLVHWVHLVLHLCFSDRHKVEKKQKSSIFCMT